MMLIGIVAQIGNVFACRIDRESMSGSDITSPES